LLPRGPRQLRELLLGIADRGTQSDYVFGPGVGVGVARGAAARAVCVGVPVGVFLAALVFAESGLMLGAVVAFVVISVFYGIVMARRMSQFWPAAKDLSGGDRVAVARAARRGRDIHDARLAAAAIEYGGGLRAVRAQARRWQRVVWLGAASSLVLAVLDSISGPFPDSRGLMAFRRVLRRRDLLVATGTGSVARQRRAH
jgi:hypothetical protein